MKTNVKAEGAFQILSSSFVVSPSNEGYTLQVSADGKSFSNLFAVSPNETRMVTSVVNGAYYKLKGNRSDVTVTWQRECHQEGGGGGTGDGVQSLNGKKGNLSLKTINNLDILGSGNIEIQGGEGGFDVYTLVDELEPVDEEGTQYTIGDTDKAYILEHKPSAIKVFDAYILPMSIDTGADIYYYELVFSEGENAVSFKADITNDYADLYMTYLNGGGGGDEPQEERVEIGHWVVDGNTIDTTDSWQGVRGRTFDLVINYEDIQRKYGRYSEADDQGIVVLSPYWDGPYPCLTLKKEAPYGTDGDIQIWKYSSNEEGVGITGGAWSYDGEWTYDENGNITIDGKTGRYSRMREENQLCHLRWEFDDEMYLKVYGFYANFIHNVTSINGLVGDIQLSTINERSLTGGENINTVSRQTISINEDGTIEGASYLWGWIQDRSPESVADSTALIVSDGNGYYKATGHIIGCYYTGGDNYNMAYHLIGILMFPTGAKKFECDFGYAEAINGKFTDIINPCIIPLTQSEYDSIDKDENTLYIITE